jgi:hypothetical protein
MADLARDTGSGLVIGARAVAADRASHPACPRSALPAIELTRRCARAEVEFELARQLDHSRFAADRPLVSIRFTIGASW